MATSLDKNVVFPTASGRVEPFDFGLKEKMESLGPKVDKGERDSNQDASLLHKFANETSAHGCAHAASSSRGSFSRWVLSSSPSSLMLFVFR